MSWIKIYKKFMKNFLKLWSQIRGKIVMLVQKITLKKKVQKKKNT